MRTDWLCFPLCREVSIRSAVVLRFLRGAGAQDRVMFLSRRRRPADVLGLFRGTDGQRTCQDFFSRLAARAEAAGLQNRHRPSLRLGSFLTPKSSETQ